MSSWQTWWDFFWLCLSALGAGAINALAGGGTLLTFPALMSVLTPQFGDGLAGVLANGTSTVALLPGSLAGACGYRREMYELRRLLVWLVPPSLFGGILGAWLLVRFPDQFNSLIPWLILTAAVLFTLQPYLTRRFARPTTTSRGQAVACTAVSPRPLAGMILLQLLIAIYGGYFGAGIGILMLSGLGLMGLSDIHQMNGLKCVLASAINSVAVAIFVIKGNIIWTYGLPMVGLSIVGGYVAAHLSRQIPARSVRWLVIFVGFSLAAYYFCQRWMSG